MSYTLSGSAANSVLADLVTDAVIAEEYGGEETDSPELRLVLEDPGNQLAYVIEGTQEQLRALAARITQAVEA